MGLRVAWSILFFLSGSSLSAQSLTAVWPPGGTAGSRVEARVEGANLGGATAALVSRPGVKAQVGAPAADGSSLPVTLEIAPDAAPGPYELRIVSPKGVSNPGYLWVGPWPERAETEPNNTPAEAMKPGKLPVTICGRIDAAEDVDWYAFQAEAGETLAFDICAYRLYSAVDPALELRDSADRLLASAMEGYDRDPRILYTFKAAGTYRLLVRDVMYRGGPNFLYRLTFGRLPVITALSPVGGRRGETLTASVEGVNLGDMKTWSVALPADMAENRAHYVLPQTPNGPALPVLIAGDDNPQATETPGSSATRPQAVPALPVTIDGRIGAAKEEDHYQFRAEAGKPLEIAVAARAIGSRLYACLRLLDKTGRELLNTEEQIGRDPQIAFTPPETGDYRLIVAGIENRGGPDYFYRLSLRPPVPDFRLTATPDILTLGRGQTVVVTVSATRRGNFNGAITVRAEGLPAGVAASPLTLGPGQSSGILTLTAAADATPAQTALRFVGEAQLDDRMPVTRAAVPLASLPRPGEGQVVPRAVEFQMATLTEDVPLYALSTETTDVTLAPGQTVMLKVRAARKPNDNAATPAIALVLANLPPGVTAETPNIAEKQDEVLIKITAAGDAQPVVQNALLTGKLGENAQPAPALRITIKK